MVVSSAIYGGHGCLEGAQVIGRSYKAVSMGHSDGGSVVDRFPCLCFVGSHVGCHSILQLQMTSSGQRIHITQDTIVLDLTGGKDV